MKSKTLIAMISACVMMFLTLLPASAMRSYDITFKSGSQGSIASQDSLVMTLEYGATIDANLVQASIAVADGYFFTGFSPIVSATVTREETFVAQYRKIVDAVTYQVNYLDENDNPLATSIVKTTNQRASVSVIALQIDGYAVDQAVKTAIIDQDGVQINFRYTSTTTGAGAVAGGTRTTTTVVVPGIGNEITVINPAGNPTTGETATNDDNKAILDDGASENDDPGTVIEDGQVPLSSRTASPTPVTIAATGALAIGAAIMVWFVATKKRRGN